MSIPSRKCPLVARGNGHNVSSLLCKNVRFEFTSRSCRQAVQSTFRHEASDCKSPTATSTLRGALAEVAFAVEERLARLQVLPWRGVELRLLLQVGQVAASLAFVALYIWSTYEPAARNSWRHFADLALSAVFAADLATRIKSAGSSWLRMLVTPLSLLDILSFAPGLLELCGAGWLGAGLLSSRLDLRWFRIFRALRLLRLCLLTGNLPLMKLSRSALLSGAVNVRLMQLVASVLALLFTSASLVHAVERLPWHDALYFVTTTLTTVGYGDVVVKTMAGRLIVLVFMAVGVVLIPVRTSQLWAQLASRRLTAGSLTPGRPVVLLSSRLTEVRGFADLTEEFFHQVHQQRFVPHDVHLMVLGNKPSHEFMAFQELHDQRITLVEGSVLSAADLMRCRAEAAAAVLVLGDRFAHDSGAEDLDVLFRVWAIKSYTKCVPLTVQVLRAASLAKVSPFLDQHQDVVMSVEQMRHRLLALSALCPGASTLLGNLLHTAQTSRELTDSAFRPCGSPAPKLAGRSWFAEYVRGCGHDLHLVPTRGSHAPSPGKGRTWSSGGGSSSGLVGCSFGAVLSTAFHERHVLVIGILAGDGRLALNPPHGRRLSPTDQLLVLAHSEQQAVSLRDLAVVKTAMEMTQRAEQQEAAEAATAAAGFTGGAAAAAVNREAREAPAVFGGSGPSPSPGDGSGDGTDGSGLDAVAQQWLLPQAATVLAATSPRVNTQGSGDVAWSSISGGNAPRVKRYMPSMASWDEDATDFYSEKEGTFFAGRHSYPSDSDSHPSDSSGGDIGPGSWWQGRSTGGEGEGESGGDEASCDWEDARNTWEGATGSAGTAPSGGGSSRQSNGMQGATGLKALDNEASAPRGGIVGGSVGGSSPHVSGQFSGTRHYRPASPTSSIDTGTTSGGSTRVYSVDGDLGNSMGGSSNDSSVVPALTTRTVPPPYSSNTGGSSGGSGGSSGNGVSVTVLGSPYSDKRVITTEADIGAVHPPARGLPLPRVPPPGRVLHGGSGGNITSFTNSRIHSGDSSTRPSISSTHSSGVSSFGAAAADSITPSSHRSNNPRSGDGSAVGGGNDKGYGSGALSSVSPSQTPSPNLGSSPSYVSAPTVGAFQSVGHQSPSPIGRPYAIADAPWRQPQVSCSERRGHIILAGALDSFVEFARVLHSCAGMKDCGTGLSRLEVVVLHPNPPEATVLALGAMGPIRVVRGSPADPRALQQAGAAQARCLVYLGHSERPAGRSRGSTPMDSSSDSGGSTSASDYGSTSRAGVQSDAEALLTCYGVGEESLAAISEEDADECVISVDDWGRMPNSPPAEQQQQQQQRHDAAAVATAAAAQGSLGHGGAGTPPAYSKGGFRPDAGEGGAVGAVRGHSVVELSFTSSVRFLQPGLLLQGTSVWDESCALGGEAASPRRSWRQRREAEVAATAQGLVQWQTNIYYGAGRVVVPALVDTFTIQAFAKRNLLLDVMTELCGDDGRPQGTPLRLLHVPRELVGRPYRELFDAAVTRGSVPLGLYRSKSENPAWRLHFVSTNPAWEDIVLEDDKVFVLRCAE